MDARGDSSPTGRLSAAERSAIARIGGLTRASLYDGREVTAPARRAFDARFEAQVDPDGNLEPAERERRARAARRAYFQALALKSARPRRRRARARAEGRGRRGDGAG